MTTPETPSHSTNLDAPEARDETAASEGAGAHDAAHPHAPSSEPNGHSTPADAEHASGDDVSGESAGPTEDAGEAHGETSTQAQGEGTAASPEKRRKRRRRKKGPAQAAGEQGSHEGGDAPAGEDGEPAEHAAAEGGDKREGKGHPKKREKRPGPPRERPPVNAGDIVFGKIIEITDEAIFIDIPGKARAIFDRREMLLPEDDDEARAPAGDGGQAAPPAAQSDGGQAASEGSVPIAAAEPTDAASPIAAEAQEPASVEAPAAHEGAGREGGATPVEQATAPVAQEGVAGESGATEGSREPPKEPKVPRVILEVGADFIGVVHNDGGRGGLVVLTHHPRRAERAKPILEKAFADGTLIPGLVTGVIKGGVEVDVDGLRAFAPGSHVDLRLGADLSHLTGRRLSFVVTQYAKRGRDVVLSRKAMLEEEARKTRAEALARLKVGEELDGVVRSVVPFGAFVDVGGVEGLVPLQEMSHNRSDGPSDVFKAGEPTRVQVIKIDDRGKVWLSRKATIPDPWQQVAKKYAVGTRHTGTVARLQPFGVFVELEAGVDGLVHVQDLSIKRIETPADVVKVGDPIEVVVAHLDPSQHKIALHPAPAGDAASEAPQRVAPHKPLKAKVVLIEAGGLLVRIMGVTGRHARGYVTAAGTGTPRGTELRKAFNVGQEIEAKVIELDPRRGEVKLSIKALGEDQERNAYQQYRQQLKAEARFTFGDLLAKKSK